jgi:AcrR family transcriptional regulator
MATTERPRRGAPRKGEASARARILATALDLFYHEGIRAVGVDTVVERSGVSKTSLYRLFDSKDALIAAVVAEQDRLYWAWWAKMEARHPEPRDFLAGILDASARMIARPGFRGCPFLNVMTEFPDRDHPGRKIADDNKRELQRQLTALAGKLGAREPELAAAQIGLMVNGAYATYGLSGYPDLAGAMIAAAEKLLA